MIEYIIKIIILIVAIALIFSIFLYIRNKATCVNFVKKLDTKISNQKTEINKNKPEPEEESTYELSNEEKIQIMKKIFNFFED